MQPKTFNSTNKTKRMVNSKIGKISLGALLIAGARDLRAQYTPPPPPAPFPGFLNEYLRKNDPYMNQWDFGGTVRARAEVKEGFGMPGVANSVDFRDHGPGGAHVDTSNEYFIERIRFRAGYTDK